jgi:flagella basal body P-ring formation protein FlgA
VVAVAAPGARFGAPSRFVVTPDDGVRFTVVAQVDATAERATARHALRRDAVLSADDVEWAEGPLDGLQFDALPALNDVLAARPRRNIASGEILTTALLRQPLAVRAGDEVSITVRTGNIEARGMGRAVSSGSVGDIIRVLGPGTRQPSRARVIAPAAVEIVP